VAGGTVVVAVVFAVVVAVVVADVGADVAVVADVGGGVADVPVVLLVGFTLVDFDGADCTTFVSEGELWLELPPVVSPPDPSPCGRALACAAVSTTAAVNAAPAATSPARPIRSCMFTAAPRSPTHPPERSAVAGDR
jgi:hypothetical protein